MRAAASHLAMTAVLIVLSLAGMSGCGGSGSSNGQASAPSITSFTASSSTITAGESTTLSWLTANAASLSIDNGVGTVTGTSVTVTPSVTTTYTLTATNAAGKTTTSHATVTVVATPSIASFTVSSSVIAIGNSVTLSWSTANAASLSIDNGVGTVAGTSVTVTPMATTTYTLTATNAAGTSVTAHVAVTVVSFTVSSSIITTGDSVTLTWSASNAASLSIDNGVGTVTGTSVTVTPSATTTYTLTVTNAEGAVTTAQAKITVVAEPSIASFTATPPLLNPVTIGTTTATLSWTVADQTKVSISNGPGTVTGSSVSVTPSATTNYTLTATNAAGTSVTATATVGVRNKLAVLAGVPYPGTNIDGTGSSATFNNPVGIATDGSGNLYVADTVNNEIRKVTPAGVVTTIASGAALTGSNAVRNVKLVPDSSKGLIKNAGLSGPEGIAVSVDGLTIYVSDTENQVIRKIIIAADGSATMSTLVGSVGSRGSSDGTGSAARFYNPTGITVDASGNLYVADTSNDTIRKITPANEVTTLSGTAMTPGTANGAGSAARFHSPLGITVGADGNLYVADTNNSMIRMVTPEGVVSTFAGNPGTSGSSDGTSSSATFWSPAGITVDANGNLYVVDSTISTVRKITPAGVVTTLAGTAGIKGCSDGAGLAASFNSPYGIAADASGNLYVADTFNNTIRKVTPAGVVTTLAGVSKATGSTDGTGLAASFDSPSGIAVDASGNLYIADANNATIRKVTPEGVVSTLAGTAGNFGSADGTGSAASFYWPQGVAVDNSGNLYIADTGNHTIRMVTPEGVVTTLAGTAGSRGSTDGTGSAARFYHPWSIAVDTSGNLYVADSENDTIRKITPEGVVSTLAGSAETQGTADGTGSAANFDWPRGIALGTNGNLYIADLGNSRIRMVTPEGVVTTLAGAIYDMGTTTHIQQPEGIAVGANGNVYVTDTDNSEILKITPEGVVSTIVGTHNNPTTSLGLLPASLYSPTGVAVDSTGNLFITVPDAVLTLEP